MADRKAPRELPGLDRRIGAPEKDLNWHRPNPARLNDTSALVRKGTHPYELMLRGQETVANSGHWTSPLESCWNAEHAFPNGRQPPTVGASPPQGCGQVLSVHTPYSRKGQNRMSPDRNRTVPGNGGGSLREAINCCIPPTGPRG